MILRPTRSPLTDTLVPYPTLFRSRLGLAQRGEGLVALAQRHRSFADQIVDAPHVGLRAGELRFGARERGLLQLHLRLGRAPALPAVVEGRFLRPESPQPRAPALA